MRSGVRFVLFLSLWEEAYMCVVSEGLCVCVRGACNVLVYSCGKEGGENALDALL